MGHTGPCKAEVGEGVEAGILKSSLLLREPFPQSLLVKWICERLILEISCEMWRGKLSCVINAKIHLKGMLTFICVAVR